MPREEEAAQNLELTVALAHWHPAHLMRREMQFKLRAGVAHPGPEQEFHLTNTIAQGVKFSRAKVRDAVS